MFAVFDGHNGGECARYLEANLASAVFAAEPTELQLRDALHTAFMAVDGKILDGGACGVPGGALVQHGTGWRGVDLACTPQVYPTVAVLVPW